MLVENKKTLGYGKSSILALMYLITCLLFLACVYCWIGNLLIWISIYLFGIPFLLFCLPLCGLFMFKAKGQIGILFSFLTSLTPAFYLIPALQNFPFLIQTDAAGHTVAISAVLSLVILLSAVLFLMISVISFLECIKSFQKL